MKIPVIYFDAVGRQITAEELKNLNIPSKIVDNIINEIRNNLTKKENSKKKASD